MNHFKNNQQDQEAINPPPRCTHHSRERVGSDNTGEEKCFCSSLVKNQGTQLNGLKVSMNKTHTEGNYETCSNSKLSKNQEEKNKRGNNQQQRDDRQSSKSSQVTVRAQKYSEQRNPSPRKVINRGDQESGHPGSISNFIQECHRKQSRPIFSRQVVQKEHKTQKTITLSNSHKQSHPHTINSIIESFDTRKNINNQNEQKQSELLINIDAEITRNENSTEQLIKIDPLTILNDSIDSQELRDQHPLIWSQDNFQISQALVDALKFNPTDSRYESIEEQYNIPIESEINKITFINKSKSPMFQAFKQQISQISQELRNVKQQKTLLEQKNIQFEMLKIFNNQKYQQMQEENQQLNDLIHQFKKEVFNNQNELKRQRQEISTLQRQIGVYSNKIQQRQEHIHELVSLIKEKNQEYEEVSIMTHDLQEFIRQKTHQYESEAVKMQKQISQLQETVEFYKERLEQEGFTFNLDEIKHLKQIFECQIDNERSVARTLQISMKNLKLQNKKISSELETVKTKKDPLLEQKYNIFQTQTQDLMSQYDLQLQQRDQQIISLKKHLNETNQLYSEMNLNSCGLYIKRVDNLTSFLLSQPIQKCKSTELVIQFVYIVNKLTKMFMMASKQTNQFQTQKQKIIKLMVQKQKYFQQEMQSINWDLQQSDKARQYITHSYEQLKMKYYSLVYKKRDSIVVQSQVSQLPKHPSLASSMIISRIKVEEPRPSQLNQTCTLISKPQSKLCQNTLEQILAKRILKDDEKNVFAEALVDFGMNMLREHKKPISLKPNQIVVSKISGQFKFEWQKNTTVKSKESQKTLFYAAPEVLLGFAESEQSYVWTIGLILDELLHGGFFYKKINLITSRQENYHCRDERLPTRQILSQMLKKKQKERILLQNVKSQLSNQLNPSN